MTDGLLPNLASIEYKINKSIETIIEHRILQDNKALDIELSEINDNPMRLIDVQKNFKSSVDKLIDMNNQIREATTKSKAQTSEVIKC